MDVPRQRRTVFAWWHSHPSVRAAAIALFYSGITMAFAYPMAELMYDSIRESLHLPPASTNMLQLLPSESFLVYVYFLIFASAAEHRAARR